MNRAEHLDRLKTRRDPWDIAIIGGGATGLGAALDAASRGHSVILIEQHDFAKATSSRSTKLVHGGVRYLEQGQLSFVFESLRERGLLLRNAPHLTRALPFLIPCYRWWEKPFYGLGLSLYDALARKLGLGRTRLLSAVEVRDRLPTIATSGLKGGVLYYDGQFDDARLAIAIARTAATQGATLVNYVKCTGFLKEHDRITGLRTLDAETGEEHEIRARVVLNATGVFVDDLRQQDQPAAPRLVQPSQGVHLVLDRKFLPGNTALMIPKTPDGRVLFAVPWPFGPEFANGFDRVIVGTTDTPVPETSLEPRALEEEIHFILTQAGRYLTRQPTRADVLSVFAGLRPLVNHGAASNTAGLSRDHTIEVSPSGLITITGGKWTTYRQMAEDVITRAEQYADLTPHPCLTHTLPLDDNADPAIAVLIASNPSLAEPLHPRLPYRQADVIWSARETMARTVEDILARRTRALFLDARASIEAAETVATLLARELNWPPAHQAAQAQQYRDFARGYLLTADPIS